MAIWRSARASWAGLSALRRNVVVALARSSYGVGVGALSFLPQENLLHQGKAYSGEIASRTLRHEGGSSCTGNMN